MRLLKYIFFMGIPFFFGGCSRSGENTIFEGDGELSRLDSPAFFGTGGWRVEFEEILLSEKQRLTYSFRGLPMEKKLKDYVAYFYVPTSVDARSVSDAQLEMILYINGTQASSFEGSLEEWICFSFAPNAQDEKGGDGLEKNYYSFDLRIPAVPEKQYTLHVNYSPSKNIPSGKVGYVYLSLGGFK